MIEFQMITVSCIDSHSVDGPFLLFGHFPPVKRSVQRQDTDTEALTLRHDFNRWI